jgi:chromosome segregation ATPase
MQSNAVLQFETWAREESSFRAETINADRERKHIEESLHQLRIQQKQLNTDARKFSDLLGRLHRECGLLEQEKQRLQCQLKGERTMLEQCTQDAADLLLHETSAKLAFHSKIKAENADLTDLLSQQEDFYVQSILDNETLIALQEFVSNKMESDYEFMGTLKAWSTVATCSEKFLKDIKEIKTSIEILRARALDAEVRGNIWSL